MPSKWVYTCGKRLNCIWTVENVERSNPFYMFIYIYIYIYIGNRNSAILSSEWISWFVGIRRDKQDSGDYVFQKWNSVHTWNSIPRGPIWFLVDSKQMRLHCLWEKVKPSTTLMECARCEGISVTGKTRSVKYTWLFAEQTDFVRCTNQLTKNHMHPGKINKDAQVSRKCMLTFKLRGFTFNGTGLLFIIQMDMWYD